ncbi:unnamed protein product [Ilex paraguariensis]|uniref:Conserved oligomeric Golgi complex subunit 4 n=1 Tax=Ilex paraguariensis TaxID=185542 RepID=A0ABC8RVF5_9AQUA
MRSRQSHVNDTLLRIDANVERGNCINGVKKALQTEDFELAAKYIQTFLQIDAKYRDSGSNHRELLLASKKQLEGIVKKRLSAAVDQRDHPAILRFIRLYSPFGLEEEGLQVYISYWKKLGEDYTDYMVSKIRGLSSVDPELFPQATRAFRSGNFSKVVQDIMGYYVILEGFFMVEHVRKVIRIDKHVLDSLTTSMVDDMFYVLQSCYRRSISTSNINSVIAVLSSVVSLLGGEYNEALQ